MDGVVECVDVIEGLVGEMMRLEVAPDGLDVVQFGRVFGQPFDGEPMGAGGQRRHREFAGVDGAIVLDQHRRCERLSCGSSDFPFGFGSEHSVEDGEELTKTGDDGDLLWPAAEGQTQVGLLDDGVVADGDERGHVQDVADGGSAAADDAMAAPLAGVAIERRDSDERGELAPVEDAQFGQLRDEGPGGDGADAGHGGEDFLGLAPGGRGAHACVDIGIDFGEFLFEEGDVAVDFLDKLFVGCARRRLVSMPIISTTCRRRATSSPSAWACSEATGRAGGPIFSAKSAMTSASMASVLASLPSALAKFLIWRGLTTASGRPAPASAAATVVSKPPVASRTISEIFSASRRSMRSSKPLPSRATAKASPDGRKCTSSRSLDTSMPTEFVTRRGSSMTLPCKCGLDRPLRLFGHSDNRTQAAPCSHAGSSALRGTGLACGLNLVAFDPTGK